MGRQAASVLVIADAGPEIGLGHVVRSLALAEALERLGASVGLATPRDPISRAFVERARIGRSPDRLPAAHMVVIDSYRPFTLLRSMPAASNIVLVTERPGPVGDAVLVIDGAPGSETHVYEGRKLRRCCLGPRYAIVPEPFARVPVGPRGERVVISLGSGAGPEVMSAVVAGVRDASPAPIDLIVGPYSPQVAAAARIHTGLDPEGVARIFHGAGLAIVGAGQTLLHAAAAALPAVAVILAQNQVEQASALERAGAVVRVIGRSPGPQLRNDVARAVADPPALDAIAARAYRMIDGRGAERAAREIMAIAASGLEEGS